MVQSIPIASEVVEGSNPFPIVSEQAIAHKNKTIA